MLRQRADRLGKVAQQVAMEDHVEARLDGGGLEKPESDVEAACARRRDAALIGVEPARNKAAAFGGVEKPAVATSDLEQRSGRRAAPSASRPCSLAANDRSAAECAS